MDILGRKAKKRVKKLEREIENLEEEKNKLENKLEAEQNRRKKAVREKQNAERENNKLNSKIEELKDKLNKRSSDSNNKKNRKIKNLSKYRTKQLLSILNSVEAEREILTTIYCPADKSVSNKYINQINHSNGAIFLSDNIDIIKLGIVPPLPIKNKEIQKLDSSFFIDYKFFQEPDNYILSIIRSDIFVLGVYENGELIFSDSFKSNIKSKHSKGGFSQKRFERKRNQEVQKHVDKSVQKIEKSLNKVEKEKLNLIGLVGEENIVRKLKNELQLNFNLISKSLDVRKGKEDEVLEKARELFWETRLYIFE